MFTEARVRCVSFAVMTEAELRIVGPDLMSLMSAPWAVDEAAMPLRWPPMSVDQLLLRSASEAAAGRDGVVSGAEWRAAILAAGADMIDLPTSEQLGVYTSAAESGDAEASTATAGPEAFDDSPDVIVIRASGLVLPRVHPVYVRWGYAIGCEQLATAIENAARAAKAVVVCFDSPGGSSAGVRLIRPSFARMNDDAGIDIHAIYRGDGKLDYYIEVELDDAGRARLQAGVDACYDQFTASVTTGRGVSRRVVENTWGAQLYTAAAAKANGLVDEIRPARDVIARCANAAGRRGYKRMGAEAAEASIVEAIVARTGEILATG